MTNATLKALIDVYGTLLKAGWGELPGETAAATASPVSKLPIITPQTIRDLHSRRPERKSAVTNVVAVRLIRVRPGVSGTP
jgi:hypothetical protein